MFFVTGILTVGLVFLFNKKIAAPLTNGKIIFLIPLVEEVAKTGLAILLGSPILLNHVFFGTAEAIDDLWCSKKRISILAMVTFLSHLTFGLLTITGRYLSDSLLLALIAAYLPHLAWNSIALKIGKS